MTTLDASTPIASPASNPIKALLRAALAPANAGNAETPTLRQRQEAGAEAAETLRHTLRPR